MSAFFAERALLPDGWANHVRLEVSANGQLTQIQANALSVSYTHLTLPTILLV